PFAMQPWVAMGYAGPPPCRRARQRAPSAVDGCVLTPETATICEIAITGARTGGTRPLPTTVHPHPVGPRSVPPVSRDAQLLCTSVRPVRIVASAPWRYACAVRLGARRWEAAHTNQYARSCRSWLSGKCRIWTGVMPVERVFDCAFWQLQRLD